MPTRADLIDLVYDCPADIAVKLGYDKLTDLHNKWIKDMVFGTEDDLIEMQMSSKSQSFSRPTWYSALSTIASGVGPPNFSRMCFSTEPEFTPMRIGRWRAFAAFTTACTRSAPPMLPGFKRILSTPDSIAASARR